MRKSSPSCNYIEARPITPLRKYMEVRLRCNSDTKKTKWAVTITMTINDFWNRTATANITSSLIGTTSRRILSLYLPVILGNDVIAHMKPDYVVVYNDAPWDSERTGFVCVNYYKTTLQYQKIPRSTNLTQIQNRNLHDCQTVKDSVIFEQPTVKINERPVATGCRVNITSCLVPRMNVINWCNPTF